MFKKGQTGYGDAQGEAEAVAEVSVRCETNKIYRIVGVES